MSKIVRTNTWKWRVYFDAGFEEHQKLVA